MAKTKKNKYETHEGHPLTLKEELFIENLIKGVNQRQSVIKAGFETKAPDQYATALLNKSYISNEIRYRMDQMNQDSIEAGRRLFNFWWDIVEGNVKDQFGLEADLNTRIKASQEIAKRLLDMTNKGSEKGGEITIKLDWGDK